MGRALAPREDFTGAQLKRLARASRDADQTSASGAGRQYDGSSRAEAAETGRVGGQIVRDWVVRFNAKGPDGLVSRKPPAALEAQCRAARPIPAVDGVVRVRLINLAAWVWDELGISVSEATLSRELKALGFSKLSARPRHHAQNEERIAAFKNKLV